MSKSIEPVYREVNLDFDEVALKEAIKHTDIGEGSYLNPMPLDAFIVSKLESFFNIMEGNGFAVNLNFVDKDLFPKCHYLKLRNRNKNQSHIMTKADWEKCFDINDKTLITYSPDGSLFLEPKEKDGGQFFEIVSKEGEDSKSNNYISYTILISFKIEGKTYYFRIDPLVKITSKDRT